MKKFTILALLLFCILSGFSQVVVVKDPSWKLEDEIKFKLQQQKWAEERTTFLESLNTSKDRLEIAIDAVKAIREVNRRIANLISLENAILMTTNAWEDAFKLTEVLRQSDNFTLQEIDLIFYTFNNLLNSTTYSINALTIVVTDNFAQMNDSERLQAIHTFLNQLKEDVAVFTSLNRELMTLNYQRTNIRSINFMQAKLNGK